MSGTCLPLPPPRVSGPCTRARVCVCGCARARACVCACVCVCVCVSGHSRGSGGKARLDSGLLSAAAIKMAAVDGSRCHHGRYKADRIRPRPQAFLQRLKPPRLYIARGRHHGERLRASGGVGCVRPGLEGLSGSEHAPLQARPVCVYPSGFRPFVGCCLGQNTRPSRPAQCWACA